MIRGIPGKPGGNNTGWRPPYHLGSEGVQPLEIHRIPPHEQQLRAAKLQYLQSANVGLKLFESAPDLETLAQRVVTELKILLDPRGERGLGFVLLLNRGAEYRAVLSEGLTVDVGELNLSLPNSIIRSAGESKESVNRGILYIPQTSGDSYFLETCADSFNRTAGAIDFKRHDVYMGSFNTWRKNLDRASLRGLGAVAAVPIRTHSHTPPVGAIFLAGPEHFLDPVIDLMPLRVLSDQLAQPLFKLTAQ